jgi:hypothetical protein
MASLGDFAATPLGVGTPYWWEEVTESETSDEEKAAATYGVEKSHRLVFVYGEEALLTRRCGLGTEAGQLRALGGGVSEGLARAKEPAFLREASILVSCRWSSGKSMSTTLSHRFMVLGASPNNRKSERRRRSGVTLAFPVSQPPLWGANSSVKLLSRF